MASTDLERLVLVLEANTSSIDRQLKRFNAQVDGSMKKAASSAKPLNQALHSTLFATGNMAAQFQDIGVQLAGGQSPFLIAIQQGTQLSAVLNTLEKGSVLKGLAAGFASLVSPVSIATIAIIGLGGTAVQYFTSLVAGTEEAAKKIDDHAAVIHKVADAWGDAIPAVRTYSNELKRQAEDADRALAVQQTVNHLFDQSGDILNKVMVQAGGVAQELFRIAPASGSVEGLSSALYDAELSMGVLKKAVADGSATARDFQNVIDDLNGLLGNDAVLANETLAKSIVALRDSYIGAAKAAAAVVEQQAALASGGPLGGKNRIAGGKGGRDGPAALTDLDFARRFGFDQFFNFPDAGKGRSKGVSEIERQRQAVKDLIADLEFEQSLIGKSDVEREQENALRQAGAAATDEQREKIRALIEEIHNEREAIERQQEAYRTLQQVGETAMNGLATALADGKLEGRELLSILSQIVSQLLRSKGFGSFLGDLFGGGLGGGGGGFDPFQDVFDITRSPALDDISLPPLPRIAPSRASGSGAVDITVNVDGANGDQHVIDLVHQGVSKGIETFAGSKGFARATAAAFPTIKKLGMQ